MSFRFSNASRDIRLLGLCYSALLSAGSIVLAQEIPAPAGAKLLGKQEQKATALRGLGSIAASGTLWDTSVGHVSLVRLNCDDANAAKIVASKYLADLKSYGAVSDAPELNALNATHLSVRHGGEWLIGLAEKSVYVAWAPTTAKLGEVARGWGAVSWQKVSENTHPRFLDNFDNASLGLWWMPTTKPQEVMDFVKGTPAVWNVHQQRLISSFAPGVYDTAGSRMSLSQARQLGRPYRMMFWSGLPLWAQQEPGHDMMENTPGAISYDFFAAGNYYRTQAVSRRTQALEQDALAGMMRPFVNDPNLMAWMEPHGEFHMTEPLEVPPGYQTRFPEFLQKERKYTLESVSRAYEGSAQAYKTWSDVPYPDNATFAGRREHFLDLDDVKWRWHGDQSADATVENGVAQNWHSDNFDDSAWGLDFRESAHFLSQAKSSNVSPLWHRFNHDVPASWLQAAAGKRVYLHLMPYTTRAGGKLLIWLNGKEVSRELTQPQSQVRNEHTLVDVTDVLRAGSNRFVIYSHGGHLQHRVFLSTVAGEKFPFKSSALNQRYLDWRDYYRWEKLQTLTNYLRFMRSIDPNRPIKVMTPHLFQAQAMDLFERYGAYPQLTGQGSFFRPMHYKGYGRLRGLPGSGEGGGDFKTARDSQYGFSTIFWESQDVHDYVFDVVRELWQRPESVQWWRDNVQLLKTLGKTDFGPIRIGLLRDTEQEERYTTGKIWNWDLSRGPFPRAGVSPVLIDGPDFTKGLGHDVPVIFDCATTVMTPEMTAAVERYVQNGGIFVAQHHTGQHTPLQRDAWILPKAFGLKVTPKWANEENFGKWPIAKILFSEKQSLWPSLRGKDAEGSGVSIDWQGTSESGALAVTSDASTKMESIAKWEDGTTAIAQVQRGKGRFILLGTPFFLKFRDQNGIWLNDEQRQVMLDELLSSLKVKLDTESSDGQVWLENRESKNGLYDLYMAGAMAVKNRDWKLSDVVPTTLKVRRDRQIPLIEAQAEGLPDVKATWQNGWLQLGEQDFAPYQIRQFAAVRDDVGLNGPLHWLGVQAKQWRALEPVPSTLVQDAQTGRAQIAASLGMDGLDISKNWKVQVDPADVGVNWTKPNFNDEGWRAAALGSWMEMGFPEATKVRYRQQITLPANWRIDKQCVVLGLRGYSSLGLRDKGQLWVNGQAVPRDLKNMFEVDVTREAATGTLNLAFQVEASGQERGPIGTMYLRRSPAPVETMDLSGEWQRLKNWEQMDSKVRLPGDLTKVFGLKRAVTVPESWRGRRIQLVIEYGAGSQSFVEGMIFNDLNYSRMTDASEELWSPYGWRVDRWLQPGENTVELFGSGYNNATFTGTGLNIRSVRLEAFPLNQSQ